jgi:hypothetical protein
MTEYRNKNKNKNRDKNRSYSQKPQLAKSYQSIVFKKNNKKTM